jgi:hypothetical protein
VSRLVPLGLAAALCLTALAGCTSRERRPEPAPPHGGQEPAVAAPSEEGAPEPLEPGSPPEQGEEAAPPLTERADAVQEDVTRRIRVAASWLDSFLGDERSLAEENDTWARLRFDVDVEDGEGVGFNVKPKIRVALPRTKRRAQLTISGDGDSDEGLGSDTADEILEAFENTEEENVSVGANYFLRDTLRNNFRIGAGFSSGPAVYGDVRYRHLLPLGEWNLRGTERVRYYTDEGFESRTALDFERRIGPKFFFRTTTNGAWYEEQPGYFYGQSLSFYQLVGTARLLVYDLAGSFVTDPNNVLDQALVRVRYRQRLWRDWIFFEVAPQIRLPRNEDYEVVPGIQFRLELYFASRDRSWMDM